MSDQKFYWSKEWRQYRAAFLKRHPICQVPGCGKVSFAVDHKVKRPIGPDFPPDSGANALCEQHHNRKTRVHDQTGKTGTYQHTLPGCDSNGLPIDPHHHWK